MFKSERTYYVILGLLVGIFVMTQLLQPKPLDWTESFSSEDKIPYGGYLIHELLPNIFPSQEIQTNQKPLFEQPDSTQEQQNWIFMNSEFGLGSWETNKLLSWIAQGNEVFIAARNFNQAFGDTLELNTRLGNPFLGGGSILSDDTARVNFTNPELQTTNGYPYFRSTTETYFSEIDSSLQVTILGNNQEQNPNFLRIQIGDGNLYLHSNPTLFTNYFVRESASANYAMTALSYLPEQKTNWDEYYKSINRGGITVGYLVSEEYLRWAWFLSLSGVLLFIIFRAKRKQRIIPHIEPPKNSSIEFAKSIGSLYLENGDHKLIAEKKIRFFFEYIRNNLGLDTNNHDESLISDVSSRSGIDITQIKSLFEGIRHIESQDTISLKDLKNLTQQIDQFYNQSER